MRTEDYNQIVYIRTSEDGDWRDYHEITLSISMDITSHKGGLYEPPSEEISNVCGGICEDEYQDFFTEDGLEEIIQYCVDYLDDGATIFVEENEWIEELMNKDWVNPWANEPD